ncbi:CAIB/BAIF family enzyme [Biscogniauxia sp. FL1348]|nr:CAIB/BAIF family enzyme [Biscogniauxia sp. FL1348]
MEPYTIQSEAARILHTILLPDPRLSLPPDLATTASLTSFDPSSIAEPFLPAPLKCSEASAALWGLLATLGNHVARERFGLSQRVTVSSDVATLFLTSFLWLRVGGKPVWDTGLAARYGAYDTTAQSGPWRRLVTNVYATRDGRYFHLHGGLDSTPCLRMLGLPTHDDTVADDEMACITRLDARVRQFDARWLDVEANEHWRQAGGVCLSPEEYRRTAHGRAVADEGLYSIEELDLDVLPAVPWPDVPESATTFRPLEGIKVVDLTRAIAGPTIAKLAALFGATVVRVSNTSMPDLGIILFESNVGKRDAHLDLKTVEGKRALAALVADADVVLDGYRPGALERLGFGPAWVREVARRRGRGIVYARENCYGWKGEWAHRSGWQQISDAVTGVAWLYGRMWGLEDDEPLMPFLPNSDFQTGIVGCVAVMNALHKRATKGGSYLVSTSLNQLNSFLIALGVQSPEVQQSLRERWPDFKSRYYDDLHRQMRKLLVSLPKVAPGLFQPRYFMTMKAELGVPNEDMTFVGPAATYETTKLGYDSGSCLRGAHKAEWPDKDGNSG